MAPTHGGEEIEGHYKEYVYSPVPASSTSAVCDSTTLGKYPGEVGSPKYLHTNGVNEKCRAAKMTEKGSTLLQYVAAAAANLCTVATGAMMGWTSPILPRLSSTAPADLADNPLGVALTSNETTWIASLIAIGAMFGSFLAGYLAERLGPKRTLLASVVPFMLGWILIASAKVVVQLYVARVILGVALSFAFTAVPMYCGEIAETSVRGALGSFLQLFITFGLLFGYSVGPYVSYTVFWILCAIIPVAFFGCFFTMPESPYYLLKTNKREEAVQSLARLRGKSPASVQKEADEMQAALEEAFRNEAKISDLFTVKANFKALIFTCVLAALQQLTGINVILFYMDDIFKAAKTSLPSEIATIIVGVFQSLASAVTPIVVDRLGRKMLLIFSGIGEIVSLGALGIYMYLQQTNTDLSGITILPVLSLIVFISTYCVGWGPLPWTVMGEMFSSNVKSKASGITVCVCWTLSFFTTKFASDLQREFGAYVLYFVFAVFCLSGVVFTILVLPETKGKSLQEIQDELNGVKPATAEFAGSSKK